MEKVAKSQDYTTESASNQPRSRQKRAAYDVPDRANCGPDGKAEEEFK